MSKVGVLVEFSLLSLAHPPYEQWGGGWELLTV